MKNLTSLTSEKCWIYFNYLRDKWKSIGFTQARTQGFTCIHSEKNFFKNLRKQKKTSFKNKL